MSLQLPGSGLPQNDLSHQHRGASESLHNLGEGEIGANALSHVRASKSVYMSSDLFEKLYLSSSNNAPGGIYKTFGNPTPL